MKIQYSVLSGQEEGPHKYAKAEVGGNFYGKEALVEPADQPPLSIVFLLSNLIHRDVVIVMCSKNQVPTGTSAWHMHACRATTQLYLLVR